MKFRPLLFSVSLGYFVNLLRVRNAGILSRHRLTGPAHAFVLRAAWHYLEHDWYAIRAAMRSSRRARRTRSWCQPEMVTLFHVTGAYIYVEPDGTRSVSRRLH